ncbi:MAG TPA: GNAT family N-acetyltransferase [Croceibacterium sp.]|nr:GNAT family N-acetyltransferase [Croceibacterium sp.]
MAEIVAETERLVLRRERPGDLAVWLEHMNTPEVMAMVGGVQPREKVAESFARMAAAAGQGEPSFYFLARKRDGTLVGKGGLSQIDTPCAPREIRGAIQVGWTLRADCWGRGYAREAGEAALRIAFERFDLSRIYAQTSQRNTASWGLMERLGMVRRADLDYPDPDYPPEDNPTMVYELDADAWRARVFAATSRTDA